MQKLTYINLNNEQAVFCGAPYVLAKIEGLGLPDLQISALNGVYQQGETVTGYRREKRVVTVTFTLLESSRAEMYARRMDLLRILSPDRAVRGDERAVLVYENDSIQYMTYAVPMGGLQAKNRMMDAQPNMKLEFRCESPYWYAMNASTITFAYSGLGFSLPFSFPVDFGRRDFAKEANNRGHVSAPVEITVQCKGEIPRIYNRTTGKRLALVSAIAESNTLYLNTDPARLDARITDADGQETGAFGRLSLETPLVDFTLQPGINELVYEAGGASAQSEIMVSWRNAYEGV